MRKTYILDTSVIVSDSEALYSFKGNDIIIPYAVLQELDNFKIGTSPQSFCAREALRIIEQNQKDSHLYTNYKIKINFKQAIENEKQLPKEFSREKRDNQILAVALQNSKNILVSKDIALRVAATALGIKAEDYKTDYIKEMDIFQNEIDQYSAEDFNMSLCTIKPKNNEQVKAFKILQEKEKKLIAFVGIAGSGKSLIALAYAIEKIAGESKKEFQKLIVMRPTISVGKEIGFLPGDLDSKMEPWIQPIYDATKILLNDKTNDNAKTNYLFQDGTIEVIPISFIRGRSLNNSLIYIDECMLPDQLVNINGTSEKLTIKEMFDLVESEDKTFFVPSYNLEKEEVETNRIVAIKRKPCTEKVYKITLENGKVLKLTENHKLYVKNKGYTKISEITREDILFEFENEC